MFAHNMGLKLSLTACSLSHYIPHPMNSWEFVHKKKEKKFVHDDYYDDNDDNDDDDDDDNDDDDDDATATFI